MGPRRTFPKLAAATTTRKTDDTSTTGLIVSAFEFANKNATRSTCPLQLPWGKGCRTMRYSTPSRKGAVDDRGSRRRHETVAHFGHPRIGRPRLCISTAWGCDIIPCQSHLFLSCIMRPVYDVVFEAHDFPLTLIGNKKSEKQLLPDFDKVDSFRCAERRIASYTPCGCLSASTHRFLCLHALMFTLSVFWLLVMICPMQCSAEAFCHWSFWCQ